LIGGEKATKRHTLQILRTRTRASARWLASSYVGLTRELVVACPCACDGDGAMK